MQCQLFCTGRRYCDFVVWTESDIHIERLYPDKEFWMNNVEKMRLFFERAILPEITGRFFSRPSQTCSLPPSDPCTSGTSTSVVENSDSGSDSNEDLKEYHYCYCQGPEEGEMVGCDNHKCIYEWFHLIRLGLDAPPTSKYWYCPDCRKLPQFRKKKGKLKLCTIQ